MKNVTFSEVKRAHGLVRYLWPVQSFTQVKAMALVYAVALPSIAFVFYLHGDAPNEIWWALLGPSLGGTGILFMRLPATLVLTTRGEALHYVGEVADLLRRLGYAEGERRGSNLHFAPRTYHWMNRFPLSLWRWKESDIDLSVRDHSITLRGPKSTLNIVKHRGERDGLGDLHHA